jgi:hypothetical protein
MYCSSYDSSYQSIYRLYEQFTFCQNPRSQAPYQIQIGELWLWEVLEGTQHGTEYQKSCCWGLGLSEEAVQGVLEVFNVHFAVISC